MNIFRNITEENIYNLLAPEAKAMGYEIVRVLLNSSRTSAKLQIMIDRLDAEQIAIQDCEKATRAFSALLDVEDLIEQKYTLEISSAGLNRPLTRVKDYHNNIGEKIKLHTNTTIDGLKFFDGKIISCNDAGFDLAINNNNKTIKVAFDNIKQATLIKI